MISAYRRNLRTAEHIQIVAIFYEICWRIAALRPGNWEQKVTGTRAYAMLGGREFIYEILRPLEEALSTMISSAITSVLLLRRNSDRLSTARLVCLTTIAWSFSSCHPPRRTPSS